MPGKRKSHPAASKAQLALAAVQNERGDMVKKQRKVSPAAPERIYWGADVPMREIRRFARAVAKRFDPEKLILFGSHGYGTPDPDSDVDILVIMPARNKHSQAYKIREAVSAPFPMDWLVRTPEEMRWRLREGDLFHTEIMSKGKILYEKGDARVGPEGREGYPPGGPGERAFTD